MFSPATMKMSPGRGCVDQRLTSLSQAASQVSNVSHEELEIPARPRDTPYALQILLDLYREQFTRVLDQMRGPGYKESINKQIGQEKVSIQSIFLIFTG